MSDFIKPSKASNADEATKFLTILIKWMYITEDVLNNKSKSRIELFHQRLVENAVNDKSWRIQTNLHAQ